MSNTKIIITIIIKGKFFHYQRNGEQKKSELRVNSEGNNSYQKCLYFVVTGTTETTKNIQNEMKLQVYLSLFLWNK